jgi:GTP-binding protein
MINNKKIRKNIDIIDAKFIISITDTKQFTQQHSEVVFLGRSNVGKSSLLNALTHKRSIAKKSQTPGKTRTINYFEVTYQNEQKENSKCMFVDLPGFGYAKVSKSIKNEWAIYLNNFIKQRQSIRIFIYLVDSRHTNLDIDNNLFSHLQKALKPDQILLKVYTKADKLNQSQKSKLLAKDKNIYFVSNTKLTGHDKINNTIYDFLFKFSNKNIKYFVK